MLLPFDEIALGRLRSEFDRCWPWIEDSLNYYAFDDGKGLVLRTHDKEHVWQRILAGKAHLFAGEASVTVTEQHQAQTGLRTMTNWLAGGDLEEIKATMPHIEEWAAHRKCHRMVGNGRKGWLEVFVGYTLTGYRKYKNLV